MTRIFKTGLFVTALQALLSTWPAYPTESALRRCEADSFRTYLEGYIPVLMRSYKIPGVCISVIKNGRILWSDSYGYADLHSCRKMTTDTYFRVESISKSLTAWGVMRLVEKGILDLDRPVLSYFKNRVIPDSEFSEEDITIRMLLSHSSGMPLGSIGLRYSPSEDRPSLSQALSAQAVLEREPGSSFCYSNTGFNILELLIEEVTGRDFGEYMEAGLFNPLGMKRSGFVWSDTIGNELPYGYDLRGNPIPAYIYAEKASGGLFASVSDIATFLAAGMTNDSIITGKIINVQSINQLYTPQIRVNGLYGLAFDSYGLGYFIERLSNGNIAVAHGGQGTGWMTHFHAVPSTGDGIVILTNSQRSWLLISHILTAWTEWNGFPPVGMSRIIAGEKMMWGLTGLLSVIIIWQLVRLTIGVFSGRRGFRLISKSPGGDSYIQLACSVVILLFLLWLATRKYLFISSLFPSASEWLAYSALLASVTFLLYAFFPFQSGRKPVN